MKPMADGRCTMAMKSEILRSRLLICERLEGYCLDTHGRCYDSKRMWTIRERRERISANERNRRGGSSNNVLSKVFPIKILMVGPAAPPALSVLSCGQKPLFPFRKPFNFSYSLQLFLNAIMCIHISAGVPCLLLFRCEESVTVELRFRNTFQYIFTCLMQPLLQRCPIEHFQGRPSSGSFLNGAYIQNPIMQMSIDAIERGLAKESLVGVHAVASKYACPGSWDILFNICKQSFGGFFSCRAGRDGGGDETRLPVSRCAPLVHAIESRFVEVNDAFPALIVD